MFFPPFFRVSQGRIPGSLSHKLQENMGKYGYTKEDELRFSSKTYYILAAHKTESLEVPRQAEKLLKEEFFLQ